MLIMRIEFLVEQLFLVVFWKKVVVMIHLGPGPDSLRVKKLTTKNKEVKCWDKIASG